MTRIINSKPPKLPERFSADLEKLKNRMLLKDQNKRPSIKDVLATPIIKKACQKLLDQFPEKYSGLIMKEGRKMNLMLDIEDDSEEEKEIEKIIKNFHLQQDFNKMMRSQKVINVHKRGRSNGFKNGVMGDTWVGIEIRGFEELVYGWVDV